MSTATLVRTHRGTQTRAREIYETDTQVDILYKGDLATAIAKARAIPLAERIEVTLETDGAFYGPDDFDTMTPEAMPMRDLDMMHGQGSIRVERRALELLRGDEVGLVPPMAIVIENIETVTAIVNHKTATGDVEELDGKRLIRITVADVEAA